MPMDCFADEIFANSVRDDDPLRCIICQGIMKNAVQCPNQHTFGEACLKQALQRKRECPMCRVPLSESSVQPCTMARNVVSSWPVHCTNRSEGCTVTPALEDKEKHEKDCAYRSITCGFSGCGQRMLAKDITQHQLTCSSRSIACTVCKQTLKPDQVSTHSCIAGLRDQIAALTKAVSGLKKAIKAGEEERASMRLIINELYKAPPKRGVSVEILSPSQATLKAALTAQLKRQRSSPRPVVGDVVKRTSADNADESCLKTMECGWVAVDEEDHQPFHVHTVNRNQYWYRPAEVAFVARVGDIVTTHNGLKGAPVKRGPDWKWGAQGDGTIGAIIEGSSERKDAWVKVKWQNGLVASYRAGAEKAHDLTIADGNAMRAATC